MSARSLSAPRLFDGSSFVTGAVQMDGAVIAGLRPDKAGAERLPHGLLAPGFVDLQVNGGGGALFNDAPDVDTLARIAAAHARLGATTILPTLITDGPETVAAAIEAVAAAVAEGVPGIAGLHLEGPHLDRVKAGAHPADRIRPMTAADLDLLCAAAARLPTLKVTLAPASASAAQIARLSAAGALVALGHAACSRAEAAAATRAGARLVTHLFNAMSPLTAREPGLVGAALADGRLSAGIIADGIHVHPDALRIATAAKRGPGRLYLVSDAMAVAGTAATGFTLGGRAVRRAAGRLTLADGTLAGADLDLARALRVMRSATDLDLASCLAMATSVPGDLIGRGGRLRAGGPADLVWLGDDLTLHGVWQGGRRIL